MDITVRSTEADPSSPASHGFSAPRPKQLPISASVWDVAQRYDKGGATVTEALFEALMKLEADLAKVKRGEGNSLGRLI